MEFWVALCISGGAAIGALAFAFCLLKLLIFYESHRRLYLETTELQWANMIRERRETSERLWAIMIQEHAQRSAEQRSAAQRCESGESLNKLPVVSAKAQTVCIKDATGQLAIAKAPRPAWPDQSAAKSASEPDAWVVIIQPSESEALSEN